MKNDQQRKAKALARLLFEEVEEPDSRLNQYLGRLALRYQLKNPDRVDQVKLEKYLAENLNKLNERILEDGRE